MLRPYKTSPKLFFTILGGVNGLHLLAAQKYLSEQHGKFPLYPHVASSRQHVHTPPSLPKIHFTHHTTHYKWAAEPRLDSPTSHPYTYTLSDYSTQYPRTPASPHRSAQGRGNSHPSRCKSQADRVRFRSTALRCLA
jgi:hypothetical protein